MEKKNISRNKNKASEGNLRRNSQGLSKKESINKEKMDIDETAYTEEINRAQKIEEAKKCRCSGGVGRFGCACIAICLVAGCAIFEYFFNHEKYCELAKNNANLTTLATETSEKVKILEQRVETLEKGMVQMEGRAGKAFGNKARAKWKVWMALKNKLESGEPFEDELKAFESTFAYDQDLIALVIGAIGAAETESQISDDTVVDAVKKYMNKVVNIRKINNGKLLEISGYVITSIEGVPDK